MSIGHAQRRDNHRLATDWTSTQEARPLDASAEAAHTAAVVNELSAVMHAMLVNHPVNAQRVAEGKAAANVVLLRGCGSRYGAYIGRIFL